jgi:hypothetical protein
MVEPDSTEKHERAGSVLRECEKERGREREREREREKAREVRKVTMCKSNLT